jgi:hypothetical protein
MNAYESVGASQLEKEFVLTGSHIGHPLMLLMSDPERGHGPRRYHADTGKREFRLATRVATHTTSTNKEPRSLPYGY